MPVFSVDLMKYLKILSDDISFFFGVYSEFGVCRSCVSNITTVRYVFLDLYVIKLSTLHRCGCLFIRSPLPSNTNSNLKWLSLNTKNTLRTFT